MSEQSCLSVSPSSTLKFKDLVPVLYQEGRYQGDPVTLGVGGFGRVELVGVLPYLTIWSIYNIYYKPWKRKTGGGCTKVAAGTLDKCLNLCSYAFPFSFILFFQVIMTVEGIFFFL